MRKIIFLILLTFLASSVLAEVHITQLSDQVVGLELPGIAGILFGNDRINIEVITPEGMENYKLVVVDKVITEFSTGILSDPTINAQGNTDLIDDILESEDPLQEFRAALDDGRITYQGVGVWSKIKLFFVSLFV